MADIDWNEAFTNFDGWKAKQPPEAQERINRRFQFSTPETLESDRQRFLSVGYIASQTGADVQEVSQKFDWWYRDAYAQKALGMPKPPKDTGEFFGALKGRIAEKKLKTDWAMEGSEAAARGESFIQALNAWQQKNPDKLADQGFFTAGFWQTGSAYQPYQPLADRLLKNIEFNEVMNKDPQSYRDQWETAGQETDSLAAELAGMDKEERQKVYALVTAKAKAKGYDQKGFWMQTHMGIVRGVRRMGGNIGEMGQIVLEANKDPGFADMIASGAPNVELRIQPKTREQVERIQNLGTIANEIQGLVATGIDPVTPTLDWMNDTVEKGLIQAPGAIGPSVALVAGTGGVGAFALFSMDFAVENRRELEAMGMDRGLASEIGALAAPLQGASESLMTTASLGRFVNLQKVLGRFSAPITGWGGITGRYLQNVAFNVAGDFTQEQFQDNVAVPFAQEVVGALRKDVPDVNWDFYQDRAIKQTPELISILAPSALLFGGVMTAGQVQMSRDATGNAEWLKATGFSEAQAAEIVAQQDETGRIAKAQELWGKREGTPKSMEDAQIMVAQQVRTQASQQREETQEAMEEANVSIMKSGDGWSVATGDGKVTQFQSHADAMQAVRQHLDEQNQTRDDTFLEAFSAITERAQEGESFTLSNKAETALDRYTAALAKDDNATADAIYKRSQIEAERLGLIDSTSTESERFEKTKEAMRFPILGESVTEFKEGVATAASRVFQNGDAMDLIEETTETRLKQWVQQGRVTWQRMAALIQQVEQATGDTYLRTYEAKGEDNALAVTEAFSELARVYATATRKEGGKLGGAVRKTKAAEVQETRKARTRLREAIASGNINAALAQALKDTVAYLRAVVAQVARLAKAKREGKLGDIEGFLNESLGVTEQQKDANAVVKEAEKMHGKSKSPLEGSRAVPADASKQTVLPDGAILVGPTTFSIRAYHGTPHKVDKFTAEKIGTGEGAQAYGWGLYFAENKAVAEGYQRNLAGRGPVSPIDSSPEAAKAAEYLQYYVGNRNAAKVAVQRDLRDESITADEADKIAAYIDRSQISTGNLYTVELLPDDGEFLDWDRTLNGKVATVVATKEIWDLIDVDGYGFTPQITGSRVYSILSDKLTPKGASDLLAKAGIPGIRYLDGNSRDGGSGTRNYVIFDENLVRILEENGKPVAQPSFSIRPLDRLKALEAELSGRAAFSTPEQKAQAFEVASSAVARAKVDLERLLAQTKRATGGDYRKQTKALMRLGDAVMAGIPSEARGKLGGYMFLKIADKATPAAQLKVIQEMLPRIDAALEGYYRREFLQEIDTLLDRAAPDKGENRVQVSKIGAEAQREVQKILQFKDLGPDKLAEEITTLEARMETADSEEALAEAVSLWGIANAFGALESRTATELSAALKTLQDIYKTGRSKWKAIQEAFSAEAALHRQDGLTDMGAAAVADDAEIAAKMAEQKKRPAKFYLSGFAQEHLSLELFLQRTFGPSSATSKFFSNLFYKSTNAYSDAILKKRDKFRDTLSKEWGIEGIDKTRKFNRVLEKLNEMRADSGVSRTFGRKTEEQSMDLEQAERVVADPDLAKSLGISEAEVSKIEEAVFSMSDRQRVVKWEKVIHAGERKEQSMSELQAVHYLLSWAQRDVKERMEKQGWDAEGIEAMRDMLSPEALAVMAYLQEEYAEGYKRLNPVYQRMYGMDLPRIENYAPTLYAVSNQGASADPFSGSTDTAGLAAGFIKTRNQKHNARLRQVSALEAYWSHVAQGEYWIAFAENLKMARAVLGNVDVTTTVTAKHGDYVSSNLGRWLEALNRNGQRKANDLLATSRLLSNLQRAYVGQALGLKIGVLMKQASAAVGSLLEIPARHWAPLYWKLVSGSINLRDIFNSQTIQRRLANGFSPEVRAAMARDGLSTGRFVELIDKALMPIGYVDAAFTTISAGIAYEYHKAEALKSGMPAEAAHDFAMEEMDRVVQRTAQPSETMNRSLRELESQGAAKLLFMFATEARQKAAIDMMAWRDLIKGQNMGDAARKIFVIHVLMPVITQTMANLYKDLFTTAGDEDDDDSNWEAWDYVRAMALGPANGIFLIGQAVSTVFGGLTGKPAFETSNNPLDSAAAEVSRKLRRSEPFNAEDAATITKDTRDYLQSAGNMGALLGRYGASAAGMVLNPVSDAVGFVENAAGD
jgi:hypothetical protein